MTETAGEMATNVLETRTAEVFQGQQKELFCRTDRMFAVLMVLQWVAGVVAALVISPRTWEGTSSSTHLHVWAAVFLGGALTVYPVLLVLKRPGHRLTRHVIAVSQALTSALLIHLTGGRIETHFHIFGSLAFLAFYRDRQVLLSAAVVVVADHLIRGIFWPQSVYGVLTAPLWRSFEHAGWVVFELTFLLVAIRQGLREMWTIADRQARMESAQLSIEQKVTERTDELRRAEARTRAVLETAADGIITIDERGLVQSFNPAAEQIFGYRSSEIIGHNVSTLMPSPYREAHDDYLRAYLSTGEKKVIGIGREVTGRRKDGTTFSLDLAVSESHDGVFTGIVRDITERKAIDRMKTEFISTVSHELRTPLTSIRGSLGLLHGGLAGELPDKATSLIEIAVNNSERLVRLVNDILDIEKIESGKMDFQVKPERLADIVEEAIAANAAYASELGVGFVQGETVPDALVMVDKDRLLQVLTNLLSNAAKFSPRGEEVTVSLTRRESGFRVEVSDRGPGIPEEFQSRIFGKFAQADSSDVRQKGGTGLGLNISKAIVEHHDGQIGFSTEIGEGTTFYFDLPALARRETDRQRLSPETDPDLPHGPRVLVCEDDPDVAHLLCLMLEQSGISVDVAADAAEARAQLAVQSYDAMTLDLMLPGVSGVQLLQDLRKDPATRHIPVVVVSAKASEGKREVDQQELGVIGWLSKPIDQGRLLESVQEAVRTRPAENENGETVRVLHVEDDEDLAQVVKVALASAAEVTRAADLAAARHLLATGDFDVVLLDLALPDGSGLDLIPELRCRGRRIPVVIFSAGDPETHVVDRVAASLVKSRTSNEQLIETITSLVCRTGNTSELQNQTS